MKDEPRRQPPAREAPVFELRPRRRAPRQEDNGPQSVSELIIPTLARLGLKTRARHLQVMNAWPGVVGEAVAAGARPAAYNRGRLVVETDSPAMGHQLHLQKQMIIDGLNAAIGDRVVTDVHFRKAPER